MGKSSKKSATKVEAAPAATTKPLKKGKKRDAEDHLDIQVNPKKQKKDLIDALHKVKADEIKAPKKVETSSDSSDSEEDHKEIAATKKPNAKNPSLKAKAESSSSEDESSSDESSSDESSSDEESAPAKKQPAARKNAKPESSSSEDESSSDEESAPAKKQPAALKNDKPESSSSEDESSSDEESAPAKNQPAALKNAKPESSSSEDESSSDEESAPAPKQPVVKNVMNAKPAVIDSSSSEDESEDEKEPARDKLSVLAKSKSDSSSDSSDQEDSDDEESDDEKPPKKKAKVLSTKTSKQESTSEESDEESEDEKVTPKKKDSDMGMVEAEQKSNAKHVKTPLQPKTPTTHTQGGSNTLFVGNLSYQIERSDVENFFKEAGEIVDVRFASHEDGSFKGFGHVEFASPEAAQKALKLHGKPLLGRDIRLDLAKEKGAYNTPRSGNAGGNYQSSGRGAGSQSKSIFVKGFDSSLGEDEIKSALRDLFSTCGEVARIAVPTDRETGAIKGIAFIDLKDGADKALELSGSEIGGRRIKVDEAIPREDSSAGDNRGRGRDNGGRSVNRGRGRDNGGRFSNRGRGRDNGGRFSRGRFGPMKPSLFDSAEGKKTVFDD